MRSRNRQIEVIVRRDITFPLFIELGHRQLTKGMPSHTTAKNQEFTIPVDTVRLACGDEMANEIEEITLHYRTGNGL